MEDQAGNRSTYGYLVSPPHYLTTNSCPSGVCIAATAYNVAGRMTSMTDSLGHSATREFDVWNSIEIVGDLLGNETTIRFDSGGNVLSTTDPLGNTASAEYDANDNRLGDQYVIGPNNQVLADATNDYQYDAEGNLIRKTERATGIVSRYTYDHRNRLVRFEQRSAGGILLAEAEYVYDVFDRRIVKAIDPDGVGPEQRQETRFAYDGQNVWADFDALNQVTARYLYGVGLDNLLACWRPSDGTAWYLTDHLGTVRHIVDGAGAIINHLDYDSFGRLVSQTNPAVGDRFGYTGREYDPELGLYYYRARYYDPQLGRFVSQDPLSFAAGDSNLYRYVGNSPLTARDPLGLAGTSLFYAIMARRASAAAGALVGGVLGFACGWLEGFTEAMASSENSGSNEAQEVAWDRAISYAAVGAALGGTVAALPAVVQFFGGGILLGVGAGMIISQASQDPWQVTAVRVGCLVVSAAVGPPAHRRLTPPISRLPFMGVRSPNTLRSPTPLVPRARPSPVPEPHPAPRPLSPGAIGEPAPSRSAGPFREIEFSFTGKTAPNSVATNAAACHALWGDDINAIEGTVERLGQRAWRQSGGDWRRAEQLFESYLNGVSNRLAQGNSRFGVEIQPGAIAGGQRVPAFVYVHRGSSWTSPLTADAAGNPRLFAFPGSRRLDAGIIDLTATPNSQGLRPVVAGFDITLDSSKPRIGPYYESTSAKFQSSTFDCHR